MQDVTGAAKEISQRFGAAVESDTGYGPVTQRKPVEVYPQSAGSLKVVTRSKVWAVLAEEVVTNIMYTSSLFGTSKSLGLIFSSSACVLCPTTSRISAIGIHPRRNTCRCNCQFDCESDSDQNIYL